MQTLELRSKEEVARDIEHTREEVDSALHDTKTALLYTNPGVRAWKAARSRCQMAKSRVLVTAYASDDVVRSNVYRSVAIAFGIGTVLGLIAAVRRKTRRCCE